MSRIGYTRRCPRRWAVGAGSVAGVDRQRRRARVGVYRRRGVRESTVECGRNVSWRLTGSVAAAYRLPTRHDPALEESFGSRTMARLLDIRDYATALRTFEWKALWELVDGTPERLNLAHECVDRHSS